jgi:flavin reductase (DIM6/NTAB) family NADH-FMN oxidoreductase RutF
MQSSEPTVFRFDAIEMRERYKLLTASVVPRPIAWITSVDKNGALNAAPFSFFNVFSEDPALVIIGVDRKADGTIKHTVQNIEATGVFTVNLADVGLAKSMVATAALFPREVSEPEALGLALAPGITTLVPRLADAPIALECELFELRCLSAHRHLVMGEIRALIARSGLFDPETKRIDPARYQPIARLHGTSYAGLGEVFDIPIPDWREVVPMTSSGKISPASEGA